MATALDEYKLCDRADYYRILGEATSLMLRVRPFLQFPLVNLRLWLEPAVELRQIKVVYDIEMNVLGFFSWAYLSEATSERIAHCPGAVLNIDEWNEGSELWIVCAVARKGVFDGMMRAAIKEMFSEFTTVNWQSRRSYLGRTSIRQKKTESLHL
jgi:cytolysin-activating lysine-acyltransferase